MKENYLEPQEWSDIQRRTYIDTVQLYDAYLAAFRQSRSYRGGMHWKKSKGREYLFRSKDRYGYGKSLGLRSDQTEKILAEFRHAKSQIKDRLASLKSRLNEQARFCRAAAIQRAPRIVAGILRVLDQQKLLGKNVIVIGTNAVYAYEAAAGVFVDTPILATADMDLLWDIRSPLHLSAGDDAPTEAGLIELLRKADRSFERIGNQRFRAANKDGYMVDLVKPEPRPIMKSERRRMGGEADLEAAEIRNLQWLASAPKYRQVVIGEDGYPAAMVCPDPRAFALHKIWMSAQPDRNPLKKHRDHSQALAVAYLVLKYLPQHKFAPSELRMFPKSVADAATEEIFNQELPPGFE